MRSGGLPTYPRIATTGGAVANEFAVQRRAPGSLAPEALRAALAEAGVQL